MIEGGPVLILAVSGRGLAAAARRAGYVPLVADCFADRDTRALAAGWRKLDGELSGRLGAEAVVNALTALEAEAPAPVSGLIYGAGLEARPGLLAKIAKRWPVLGNAAETMQRVKDPAIFFPMLDDLVVPHPAVSLTPPLDGTGWLRKRKGGSGGGHIVEVGRQRVTPSPLEGEGWGGGYSGREPVAALSCPGLSRASTGSDYVAHAAVDGRDEPGHDARMSRMETAAQFYFQRKVRGRSVSTAFISDASGVSPVGLSEQWTAPAPGRPMRYGGAVQPAEVDPREAAALWRATRAVAGAFGLRGIGSADFLLTAGGPLLLEVNARPGATLDIFDDPEAPLLAQHIAAVTGGQYEAPEPSPGARAAAIVHADRDTRIADDFDWPAWAADIPQPGERIAVGRPVCTVFAHATDSAAAKRLVVARVSVILSKIQEQGGSRDEREPFEGAQP